MANPPDGPSEIFNKHKAITSSTRRHPEKKLCDLTGRLLCLNCMKFLNECSDKCGVKLAGQLQNPTPNYSGNEVTEISINDVEIAPIPFDGGGYADVLKAKWQNQSVVLKVLRRHGPAANTKDLSEEARIAMSLDHPNVVHVFGVVLRNGSNGILMEKANLGSLRSALKAANSSFYQLVLISIDIVSGLEYIHSQRIIHLDLKPDNVLLFGTKSQPKAKIADFGLSICAQKSLPVVLPVGTLCYMAPELFQTQTQARYGFKVDVYSLAVLLYEVFSGRHISDSYPSFASPMQFAEAVGNGMRPEIPESFPAELRTVIKRGWSAKAEDRPTPADFKAVLSRLKESLSPVSNANRSGNGSSSNSGTGIATASDTATADASETAAATSSANADVSAENVQESVSRDA